MIDTYDLVYCAGLLLTAGWLVLEANKDPEYWTGDVISDAMGITVLLGLSILWFITVPLHLLNRARES